MARRKESTIVGLEIEAGSVAAAEVSTNGGSSLIATAIAPLAPEVFHDGEVADPEALAHVLRDLFSSNNLSRRVRLGIANQWVVVRTLRLPAIDDPDELAAAVRFQAQEEIPMPLDQAVLDHRVIGGVAGIEDTAPQIDVVVVAARRDMIAALLKPLRDAGLQPVGVDLSAFGLIRALATSTVPERDGDDTGDGPVNSTILYCHIGAVTDLAIAKGRSCLFTRVSPVGLESWSSHLASAAGLTLEHARMWLFHVGMSQSNEPIEGDPTIVEEARTTLGSGASSLLDELRLSLDFYGAQDGAVAVEQIVLCGPGSAIPGLLEHMEAVLGLPFSIGRPRALAGLDDFSAARLTLSYGLALED
jgi:type IV pilus assembly protein PilM